MKKYSIKNGSTRAIMVGGGPASIIKPGKTATRELDEAASIRLASVKGVEVSAVKEEAPTKEASAAKEPQPAKK